MQRSAISVELLLLLFFSGCACYRVNPPLAHYDPAAGYRYRNLTETPSNNTEKNFIIVTMSGGGTRAAALAYGAAEHMNAAVLDRSGTTLLDEVDVISSVSGGSFAAAYLTRFGKEKFIRDFPHDVLDRRIERDLLLRAIAPWNWPEMLLYGRSDLAERYYNDHIFDGDTFDSLPRRRPFVILNATDLTSGATFAFTQDDFDRICSDLGPIPLSRGVLASSAFPVGFTPITLKNYGMTECGYQEPGWTKAALLDFEVDPPRYQRAAVWTSYEDPVARPYIHLSDGGIADNLGLRGPEVSLSSTDSPWTILNRRQIEKVALIVIDAKPANPGTIDQSPRRPSFTTVVAASASNPIANYSFDTVESLRRFIQEQRKASQDYQFRRTHCDKLATELCNGPASGSCVQERQQDCYQALNAGDQYRVRVPKYYEIHVQFDAIKDPEQRAALEKIPTTLQLPDEDVRILVQAAGEILDQSKDYRELLTDLRVEAEGGGR